LLALSSAGNRFLVLTIGQHNLALKYYDEIGVAKDLAMARSWFQKSSDQNFGGFQRMLGKMMVKGAGGERLVTGGRSCKSSCKTRQPLCNRVATKTPQVPSKKDYGSIHFN
jgi:TPR repeat protein